jgi:hypothetical protein
MSSNTLVVFYGVRAEVQPGEVEALRARTDPRLLAAGRVGLKHYLALAPATATAPAAPAPTSPAAAPAPAPGELPAAPAPTAEPRSYLFLGAQLAVIGPGRPPEVTLSWRDLQRIAELTRKQLASAKIAGEPALFVQWRPVG